MSLLKPPDPNEVLKKIKETVAEDKKPGTLLWELMTAKSYVGKYTAEAFYIYRESWLYLTSPEGRRYVKNHVDDLLDYVEKVAREIK